MKYQFSKQKFGKLAKINWKYGLPVLIVISAIIAYFIGMHYIKKPSKTDSQIQEQRVTQGDIKIDITADGQVSLPIKYLDFQVQGRIKSILVKPGQMVKKGDVLAELDSESYIQDLQKAQIAYDKANLALSGAPSQASYQAISAKEKLDEAKQTYDDSQNQAVLQVAAENEKLQQLKAAYINAENAYMPMTKVPDAYSKNEIESAKLQYENAKTAYDNEVIRFNSVKQQANSTVANAKQKYEAEQQNYQATLSSSGSSLATTKLNLQDAKNSLNIAKQTVAKTVLTAPSDGKIMYISKEVGDLVNTSSSTKDDATADTDHFIVFSDSAKVQVTASVAEEDVKNVSIGQKVDVKIDAVDDDNLTGKVIGIESLPKIDSNGVATYLVTCELDQENDQIMQGMSGTIDFILSEKRNVLTIPNKAVTVEDGVQYAEVKDQNGKIEKRQIQTGLSDGENAEVISGLKQGETVIVRGQQ